MFNIETQLHVFRHAHESSRGIDIKIMLHLPISRAELAPPENDFVTPVFLRGLGYKRESVVPYEYLEHRDGPTVGEMLE